MLPGTPWACCWTLTEHLQMFNSSSWKYIFFSCCKRFLWRWWSFCQLSKSRLYINIYEKPLPSSYHSRRWSRRDCQGCQRWKANREVSSESRSGESKNYVYLQTVSKPWRLGTPARAPTVSCLPPPSCVSSPGPCPCSWSPIHTKRSAVSESIFLRFNPIDEVSVSFWPFWKSPEVSSLLLFSELQDRAWSEPGLRLLCCDPAQWENVKIKNILRKKLPKQWLFENCIHL